MARTSSGFSQALIYLEIIKRLPRHWVTSTEIMQSLQSSGIEIETLTLQRYLKELAESDEIPVERDTRTRPYGYRLASFSNFFSFLSPSPQESLLLKLIQEYLKYQLPGKLAKTLDPFFDAAMDKLDTPLGHVTKERHWLDKIAVVSDTLPRIPPSVLPRIFDDVTNALFEEKKIQVKYHNAEGERKEAILSPLGLVQQDCRLYLVCQFDGYDNYRHLALHRIDSVKQLKDNAQGASGFKVKEYIKSRHFNYTGDKTRLIHLIIEFKNAQSKVYLEESPFNRTQKITEPEQGLYRLEVDIVDSILVDGWIKMWESGAQLTRVIKEKISTTTS